MLQPPDFDSRYKVLSQKRHLKILFGASGKITVKEMSRPERILKSAARKVSSQIAAWKLAWAEFGRRHPRMKSVPSWGAVFVFTGLGQSILGLLALFYVAPWYVWPLTLFFSAALGEAFVIHYAGIAYERIKREEIEKLENENWLLMNRFYPELAIDYRPNQGEPFVQIDYGATQYRVSVRSPVETMAELVVNHVTISQRPKLFDVHLRPMHETDQKSGTKRIKLSADGEMYWDLVSVLPGEDGRSAVVLSCIPFLGVMEFDPGEHEFELMTKGGDKPGATKIVTLQVGDDHTVTSLDIRDGRLSSSLLRG